jgi:hypothetical protein
MFLLKLLDPGGHVEWPDRWERKPTILAPGEKPAAGTRIGPPRVIVVDVGGEEFDIAPVGLVAEIGDQRRHYIGVDRRCRGGEHFGFDDRGELVEGGRHTPALAQIFRLIEEVINRKMGGPGARECHFGKLSGAGF